MPFELTINGKTQKFNSGAEMAEWMERQKSVKPHRKKRRKKKHATEQHKNRKATDKSSPLTVKSAHRKREGESGTGGVAEPAK